MQVKVSTNRPAVIYETTLPKCQVVAGHCYGPIASTDYYFLSLFVVIFASGIVEKNSC